MLIFLLQYVYFLQLQIQNEKHYETCLKGELSQIRGTQHSFVLFASNKFKRLSNRSVNS
jgi:hypothetical protein